MKTIKAFKKYSEAKQIAAKTKAGYYFLCPGGKIYLGDTELEAGANLNDGVVADKFYTGDYYVMWQYCDGQLSNNAINPADLVDNYLSTTGQF